MKIRNKKNKLIIYASTILILLGCSCDSSRTETKCDEILCETFSHIKGIKSGNSILKHKDKKWLMYKRNYLCANIVNDDTLYCYTDTIFSINGVKVGIHFVINNDIVKLHILDSSIIYKKPKDKIIY